jgi:hypothetical protein
MPWPGAAELGSLRILPKRHVSPILAPYDKIDIEGERACIYIEGKRVCICQIEIEIGIGKDSKIYFWLGFY